MRAVNLIPSDQRRRSSGAGRGFGAYVVLGVLALVVAVGAAYALTSRSVTDRRDELARIQAQTKLANADAQALQAYTSFADLRQKRNETVRSLAVSRFDWSAAVHEVARTIPANAWLTGMRATVTPSTTVEGGVTDPLRASMQVPAIELTGCTTSQDKVAGVIASLRRVHGIQRVSLSSSEKLDAGSASAASSAAGAGGKSGSDDCRNGNTHLPKFSMTLFFEPTSGSTTGGQPTAKEKTP